jgi:hypothetical protein
LFGRSGAGNCSGGRFSEFMDRHPGVYSTKTMLATKIDNGKPD